MGELERGSGGGGEKERDGRKGRMDWKKEKEEKERGGGRFE